MKETDNPDSLAPSRHTYCPAMTVDTVPTDPNDGRSVWDRRFRVHYSKTRHDMYLFSRTLFVLLGFESSNLSSNSWAELKLEFTAHTQNRKAFLIVSADAKQVGVIHKVVY